MIKLQSAEIVPFLYIFRGKLPVLAEIAALSTFIKKSRKRFQKLKIGLWTSKGMYFDISVLFGFQTGFRIQTFKLVNN